MDRKKNNSRSKKTARVNRVNPSHTMKTSFTSFGSVKELPTKSKIITSKKQKSLLSQLLLSGYDFSALSLDEDQAEQAAYELLLHSLKEFPFHKKKVKKHKSLRGFQRPRGNTLQETMRKAKTLNLQKTLHLNHIPQALTEELKEDLRSFVHEVRMSYTKTSFHNFSHALDVCQLFYHLLNQHLSARITPDGLFFCLVTALCHDIRHPGANYAFLSKHSLLPTFKSLEEYHIEITLDLVDRSPLFTPDKHFSVEQINRFKNLAKLLIDATDIMKNKQFCDLARLDAANRRKNNLKILGDGELCLLIKLSDLANVIRPFTDAENWSAVLAVETRAQEEYSKFASKETCELDGIDSLQESLLMIQTEIEQNGMQGVYNTLGKNTMGFINAVVKDIVNVLNDICPQTAEEYGRRIRKNQENWLNGMA